jgi:hypothetical protein
MAREIKKTMVAPLAYLAGVLTSEQLEDFTNQFGYTSTGTSVSTGPKEVTILRDGDVVVGRKCTVTGMFFDIEKFSKNTTCIKEADAAKGKLYNESKKMEEAAKSILEEARTLEDIEEKVAKFEEYDVALQEAKAFRTQTVAVEDSWLVDGFATIEELAEHLGVDLVQTTEEA